MKGKMYLWRGRCIHEGEDVFMKGKMYLWREDVFVKRKMYSHRRHKQIPEFLKEKSNVTCESPFLQKIPDFLNLLQLRVSTTQKGNEDVLTADSLQMQYVPRFPSKNPGFLWGVVKGSLPLWKGRCIYEGEDVFMKGKMY